MIPTKVKYEFSSVIASPVLQVTNVSWRFWGLWLFILVAVAAVFLSVIEFAPFLHGDEFMIVDLGRVILNPDSGWSITWLIERNQPVFAFFYIGPAFQELTYQVFGEHGPRVSGFLGALVAATSIILWLLARHTPKYIAMLLGVIFLLDPIFVQSYTLGRVDGWSIFLCLGSCWILRNMMNKLPEGFNFKKQIVASGILAALAVFVWPSSVFLFPLILSELYYVAKKQGNMMKSSKSTFPVYTLFSIAGCFATVLILIPITLPLSKYIGSVLEGMLVNIRSGPSAETHFSLSLNPCLELIRSLKFTPFLFVFSLIGAAIRKDFALIFSCLAAMIIMLFTLVYIHRVLYLLPYFIAMVAGTFDNNFSSGASISSGASNRFLNILRPGALSVLLMWSLGLSLVVRTVLALDERDERDRKLVYQAALDMVGPGEHTVYLTGPEFYLAGRSLGWKMFRRYAAVGDPLSPEKVQPLLTHIDFIIMSYVEETKEFEHLLNEGGFQGSEWYGLYAEPVPKFDGNVTNIHRLRNLYSIFRQPYGPYKLYARKLEKGSETTAENIQE